MEDRFLLRFQLMTLARISSRTMTLEQYLAFEETSLEKHEYYAGEIFAMAGGTAAHALICANVARALGNATASGPCRVYNSDLRVKTETALYTYPDVTVVCSEPALDGQSLTNPTIIVEILSEATEAYDRGKKFELYRRMPSLLHYVLLSQAEVIVEHFARQTDGSWALRELRSGIVELGTAASIAVEDAYAKVFPPVPT